MAEFSITDGRRVTTLSLMDKAITLGAESLSEAFDEAVALLEDFDEANLFEAAKPARRSGGSGNRRSGGRSGDSGRKGSGSRKSSRGRGGNADWRNDPATRPQIEKAISDGAIEAGYSEDELADMTKGEISDLIDSGF